MSTAVKGEVNEETQKLQMVLELHASPARYGTEVPRRRLHKRFERSAASVMFVQAPLGFGKTTLAAQLTRDQANRLYARPTQRAARRPKQTWLARLHGLSRGKSPLWLVVDNADLLSADDHLQLTDWIVSAPSGTKLLVLSRADLRLHYAPLYVQYAEALAPDELLFDSQEHRSFLGTAFVPPAGGVTGWPLGLSLSRAALPQAASSLEVTLKGQAGDHWPALCAMALLSQWTEQSATHLAPAWPGPWLEPLMAAGFPALELTAGVYEPLAQVRAALTHALARNRAAMAQALTLTLDCVTAEEDLLALLAQCVQGDVPACGQRVLSLLATRYQTAWRFEALTALFRDVPAAWMTGPLTAHLGQALMETGQSAQAEVVLRGHNTQTGLGGNPHPDVLYAMSILAGRQGQPARQRQLAQQALGLMPSSAAAWKLRRSVIHALMNLGEGEEALRQARALVSDCEQADNLEALGDAYASLQVVLLQSGSLLEAERALQRALKLYRALGRHQHSVVLMNDLADLKRLQGQTDVASALMTDAVALAVEHLPAALPLLQETRGDIAFACVHHPDGPEEATAAYRAALELCDQHAHDVIYHRVLLKLAEVTCTAGLQHICEQYLTQARTSAYASETLLHYTAGLLALRRQDLTEAQRCLTQAAGGTLSFERRLRVSALLARLPQTPQHLRQTYASFCQMHASQLDLERLIHRDQVFLPAVTPVAVLPARTEPAITPSPQLQLLTLGRFALNVQGREVKLAFAKASELLTYLAVHGPSSKEKIINALWDGENDRRHVDYFKVALREVRLGLMAATGLSNPVVRQAQLYQLTPQLHLETDFGQIRQAIRSRHPEELRRALQAYTGEFLPRAYAEWACTARAQMAEDALTAAVLLGRMLRHTDHQQATAAFEQAIHIDPLFDTPYHELITLYREQHQHDLAARYERDLNKLLSEF